MATHNNWKRFVRGIVWRRDELREGNLGWTPGSGRSKRACGQRSVKKRGRRWVRQPPPRDRRLAADRTLAASLDGNSGRWTSAYASRALLASGGMINRQEVGRANVATRSTDSSAGS